MPPIKDQVLLNKLDLINANVDASLNLSISMVNQSIANVADSSQLPSEWEAKTGTTNIELPDIINPYDTFEVPVSCTVNTTSFVQDSPSIINVQMTFHTTCWHTLDIRQIEVQPVNALDARPAWYLPSGYETEGQTDFYLYQVDNIGADQVWSGSNWGSPWMNVFFQDAGQVSLKITILAFPQSDWWNMTDWQTYNSYYVPNFNKTVTIPNIYIESNLAIQAQQAQQTYQQQQISLLNQSLLQLQIQRMESEKAQIEQGIDSDWNRSLTYFILFFALFDITIAILAYSRDDDRKAEYKKRKANREKDYIFQSNGDGI